MQGAYGSRSCSAFLKIDEGTGLQERHGIVAIYLQMGRIPKYHLEYRARGLRVERETCAWDFDVKML